MNFKKIIVKIFMSLLLLVIMNSSFANINGEATRGNIVKFYLVYTRKQFTTKPGKKKSLRSLKTVQGTQNHAASANNS